MTPYQLTNSRYTALFVTALIMWILLSPELAFASSAEIDRADPLGSKLCSILTVLLGRTSQAIAIVGIFAMGITALSGKMQWTACLIITTGLLTMFLAPQIVMWIVGSDVTVTCITLKPATPEE